MSKKIPFIGILFATATNMLMQTVVATILPQITDDLGGESLYGWAFSIFLLASTITIPLFSKLADSYGYKKFFILGMTIFLIGSLLCGLSSSMLFFIMARMIQGLGVGALGPVTIALIATLFSIEDRGKAMGMYAAIQLLSNVLGPILGGMVAQRFGWNWAFYIVIPFRVLSILFIYRFTDPPTAFNRSLKYFDWIGAFILGASIAMMIQAWTRLGETGFDSITLTLFIASILLLLFFVFQEKKHEDPVISPDLIRIRNVQLANISAFLVGILMYRAIAILPLYANHVLGSGAVNSGKLLIPLMAGMGLGVIISGRIIKRFSYKSISVVGWIMSCISLAALSVMSMIQEFNFISYIFIFLLGFGLGILLPTFLLPAQNAVSESKQAVVGAMVQLSRNSGGAIGIPILTGLLAISDGSGRSGGYWFVFMFLTASTVIGLILGLQYKGSIKEEMSQGTTNP
ncbi:MFS transporter [Pseudalkalibacillus sp. A8]|uniref:MFS transporter n=1 Tax=Pseudalkalibacillus sp. A8 TaxID=3382641 RepID=UPI0038B673C4